MAAPNASTPRGAPASASSVAADTVRVGIAGLVTAAAMFGEWTALASRYVEQVGETFAGVTQRGTSPQSAAAAVLDAYAGYARDVAALPPLYGLRFYSELARLTSESARK